MNTLINWGDAVNKRTPPILQPVFIAVMLIIVAVVMVVSFAFWLIGFYTCRSCGKTKHLVLEGKARLEGGKVVCSTCEDKY